MRKVFLIVTIFSGLLIFNSCSNQAKVNEGEMLPAIPGHAEVMPYEDGSGLVRVTVYATDGTVLEQGDYLNNRREGVYSTFYESGLLKSTSGYVNGLKQGQEVTYDDRGTVEQRATYHQGVLEGSYVVYLRNRIKEKRNYIKGELNGELQKYYPTGGLMESTFYKDGQLDGVASWYDQQGNKTIEYTYEMGKLVKDE